MSITVVDIVFTVFKRMTGGRLWFVSVLYTN